ncbi:hypothetical protein BIY24_09850 [Halobacteriovorax marinus]|uniref:Uncharacterized protein n=1 Tax=Halobacteriovorax marinus (strain ATCC BAA-682 / DSM 15412 / SJ) TaxID=862908 RepID=E1X3I1_HALMS|nr:hypothetical protein [Halobacteriovorax marinus]ATH08242.1 hypothetical protein BIY24_09850 [Halobacteriovorax marinus]CBW26910.1 conserved hypothetical protein [Halobacteriovorax marinus SJ]
MKKGITLLSFILLCESAMGMGLFRSRSKEPEPPVQTPSEPPAQTPRPDPSPDPRPVPTDFVEVASQIGTDVDQYFGSYQALRKDREDLFEKHSDYCEVNLESYDNFSERIAYFVESQLEDTRTHLSALAPYYSIPRNENDYFLSGLAQRPLCHSTRSSLVKTLKKSNRVPSSAVIAKLNAFESKVNLLREEMLEGSEESRMKLVKTWTKFFSCLAYTESLTSSETSSSRRVAAKYEHDNYRKPAGVKFYEDPYQDEASKLNIGLFQFTPNGRGNINPCLKSWNDLYPSCSVSTSASKRELIEVFGSSLQTMNAFCGVNKVVQTFSIQTNSSKSSATHPLNSGRAKQDRCVSPWIYSGYAYNHFGPLMNSTGSNLNKLISCVNSD